MVTEVILISGKARHGKDTLAKFIKEALEHHGVYRVAIVHYADVLKDICTRYAGWDGNKDEKGRSILQKVGERIRDKDPDFFVRHLFDLAKTYFSDMEFIIIPDVRYENEILYWDSRNALVNGFWPHWVNIERPNFDNGLTKEQQEHSSEKGIDASRITLPLVGVLNDGALEDLKDKASDYVKYFIGIAEFDDIYCKGEKMTIDIPYDIGDPVLVLEFDQHDGYYLDVKKFSWSLMDSYLNGKVFGTIKEAQIALEEANGIHEKS